MFSSLFYCLFGQFKCYHYQNQYFITLESDQTFFLYVSRMKVKLMYDDIESHHMEYNSEITDMT